MTRSRPSLNAHLFEHAKVPDDLRHLIVQIGLAARYVHHALRTTEAGLSGSVNQFGEEQLKLDVLSNELIEKSLRESRLVATYISEEQSEIVELSDSGTYSVVFDPLDGSSLVDANFAIGSIFGIYKGKEVIGKKPREQVAALYVLYGPRTILVYSAGKGLHEFILNEVGEFVLLRENIGVGDEAKNYAPGNLRAYDDPPQYERVVRHWLEDRLTLRYSGCMVADVHHIFSKGQGVFTFPRGNKYPEGKLRHVFECGPFAYLMEQAGGAASDGTGPIVDKVIKEIDQRSPIIIGSKKEVEKVCQLLAN